MQKPQIFIKFQKQMLEGKLELPSLPAVTMKIKQAASDPEQDLIGIAKIAGNDPGFCGYLINLANSPMYRGVNPSKNIQQALGRIGMKKLRSIALSYATRNLFTQHNSKTKRWLSYIWNLSVYTASINAVIAAHLGTFSQEDALLAGLMQDVGALPLIMEGANYTEVVDDPELMALIIDKYASVAGESIMLHWGMDKAMVNVVKERENWSRAHNAKPDLADLTLIARYHALLRVKSPKILPKIMELPVIKKLALNDIEPDQSLGFIKAADKEMQKIKTSIVS